MADRGPHADRRAHGDHEGGDEVGDPLRPRREGQRALDLIGAEPGLAVHRHLTHDRSIVRGLRTGVRIGGVSDAEVLPSAVAWLATERAALDTEVTRWLPVTPLGRTEPLAGSTSGPRTFRRRSVSTQASSAGI